MTTEQDKERWKEEANQLKSDLSKRKKIVRRRKVDIKFPKKSTSSTAPSSNFNNHSANKRSSDQDMRNMLGI
tara:strand:+ start:71 stop:286 length:216 start_codon:yes stop_codon:yes gene_type:complete